MDDAILTNLSADRCSKIGQLEGFADRHLLAGEWCKQDEQTRVRVHSQRCYDYFLGTPWPFRTIFHSLTTARNRRLHVWWPQVMGNGPLWAVSAIFHLRIESFWFSLWLKLNWYWSSSRSPPTIIRSAKLNGWQARLYSSTDAFWLL